MVRKLVLSCIAAVACSLAVAGDAHAQDFGFEQGVWELQVSGSGTSDKDFDTNTGSFDVGLNYFIVDQWSIGLDLQGSVSDPGPESWGIGAVTDYNFALGRFQPFIGVNFGYLFGDNDLDTFYAGPEAGLKIFLTEDAYIHGTVQYQFLFDDAEEADEAFEDGRFWYGLGIGVLLGD
jgi:hypothetical protein